MSVFYKLIKEENVLIKIKTKSNIGFWHYQLFGLLSLFMDKGNDYFVITDKRIVLCIKENIKANFTYKDFSKIEFNTKNNVLSFVNKNNEIQNISLSGIKLEYEDYQFLKRSLEKKYE